MPSSRAVDVPPLAPQRLLPLIGPERLAELMHAADRTRSALGGAAVWNISSTSVGGGVAEMLHVLIGYSRGSGVDTRWALVEGDQGFFQITKRFHNRLHGAAGDGGGLGAPELAHYHSVMESNASSLVHHIRPDDVVILHDPQTAGLGNALAERGVSVVWRCHIGTDRVNAQTEEAWAFLAPLLQHCKAYVFSHKGFVPPHLQNSDVWIIPPSIDPYSSKNRDLSRTEIAALLTEIGSPRTELASAREHLRWLEWTSPLGPDDQLVVQVSRWDRLKDMQGVMTGFAERVVGRSGARLALVGPAVESVTDDPEGRAVLNECLAAWHSLPPKLRASITLVTLPMEDIEVNALMVNAVQRRSTIVVQKSLEEGFGLTVTEAMWKSRPVIASGVGGITDQVAPGTGILLADPSDLAGFGDAVADLLARPKQMAAMGRRARRHVQDTFVGDRHLVQFSLLIEHVLNAEQGGVGSA